MFNFEQEIMESILLGDMENQNSISESNIDFTDEMSIIEVAVDAEIAEACNRESAKRGKICEKCGKSMSKCECSK